MKHAYLIIAHHEFEVLQYLINTLDDARNDVFIHFDKKVKELPTLSTQYAGLYLLEDRQDIRWGHTSQMSAMFSMFDEAFSMHPYTFYHLISGVHLPLKSQDYLHHFFNSRSGQSFVTDMPTSKQEVDLKMRRYHFFIRNFMHSNKTVQRLDQLIWLVLIKLQQYLKIKRYPGAVFRKASQWCSLNHQSVAYLLSNKKRIMSKYKYTFCCDEFFICTELKLSSFASSVVNCKDLLQCEFAGVSPRIYTEADESDLIDSRYLFARKFAKLHIDVVKTIVHITNRKG